ncbi:UNKNOWN [Stylonychia lemnae]|uniref:Uncharacterized protein n=1 Tax=Stylonychia lemnae TaxID=5949 RepID=A0A078AKG5_STYLE|nr:UNKNOWN [Stylonychia lemnae]|eukprot:CDW82709.1 UNKNOWN [Stylonychia lemnae]
MKTSSAYKKMQHQLSLFKLGESKLDSEFDISKIILKLRNLELLTQMMISKYQRTIIPFMSENVLNQQTIRNQNSQYFKEHNNLSLYLKQIDIQKKKNQIDKRIYKNLLKSSSLLEFDRECLSQSKQLNVQLKENLKQNIFQHAVSKVYQNKVLSFGVNDNHENSNQ